MPKALITRALTALGLGSVGVAAYASWVVSGQFRPWPPYYFTPYEINVEAEDVEFISDDGLRIAGWWFDDPESDIVVVLAHGHRGNKSDLLGLGPMLHKQGYSTLLFDFRGSGDSDDGPRSLANHEQADLRAAIDWAAARRPDAKIVLLGMSMGAATALLVGADDPRVEAFVLDSPFATASGVVAANIGRYGIPAQPVLSLVRGITRLFYGHSLDDARPVDAIARAHRPILLMHGTDDRVTPFAHSQLLRDAAQPGVVEFHAFDTDHCGGYFVDRPGYVARVDEFIRRALG